MEISRGTGLNESESYLAKLCDHTFLSLWSYPNLYRSTGKELADLTVVFGNNIILFSDKSCKYPDQSSPGLNWRRWFTRTIAKSAQQLWGAERWIKTNPQRIFLDPQCTSRFPFPIDTSRARIHLVLVAHGASGACRSHFGGGSGSLMIRNWVEGADAHTKPFVIGDIAPKKTYVHVFDDTTLDIIMETLDTIADFVTYLGEKVSLLRSDREVSVAGEEELLPVYLSTVTDGQHAFDFPKEFDGIVVVEGHWQEFCKSPSRKAQIEADKISYFWDGLIEQFNKHAIQGTQYWTDEGGVRSSEQIMRFFASTTRFERRILSKCLLGIVAKTPPNHCGRRVSIPTKPGMPFYVFVAYPRSSELTEDEYREIRAEHLKICCILVRSLYPQAKDVVGLATESDSDLSQRSEDAVYFDGRLWDAEMQQNAEEVQRELGIFIERDYYGIRELEFPPVLDEPP